MKNKLCAGLAIKVAVFYFSIAAVGQSIQAQQTIQFRLAQKVIVIVPAMVDGQGPFDFMLDTGADTTIVDPSVAGRLPLPSKGQVEQTTLAGVGRVASVVLTSLEVGPSRVVNLPVLVEDLSSLRKLDPHIVGIAGQDFLSHFNYLVDYSNRFVRFEQGNEMSRSVEGDRLSVGPSSQRMLIVSEGHAAHEVSLRLVLDSGANALVLRREAWQGLGLSSERSGLETVSNGAAQVQTGRVRSLTVGTQQLANLTAAAMPAEPVEAIGDGLLPMALFRSVYVNNQASFVVLNARISSKN